VVSLTPGTVGRRGLRWSYRHWLWEHSSMKSVRSCGRLLMTDTVDLVVGVRDGVPVGSWKGLVSCGSPWACPVCTARISDERTRQIGAVLDSVRAGGSLVVMVTFTVRHTRRDALAKVWGGVTAGWGAATSGRAWNDIRTLWKPAYVRALEVTHGENGWHVHIHAAIVIPNVMPLGEVRTMGSVILDMVEGMWTRWDSAATAAGLSPGLRSVGSDWRIITPDEKIQDYLGKWGDDVEGWGVAQELGLWDAKKGLKGRTPWQILAGVADGSAEDLDGDTALWKEWETVSKGKRRIHTSRGFWKLADVVVRSDEEIAADVDAQADDVVILSLGRKDWALVVAARCDWVLLEWAVEGRAGDCFELLRLLRLRSFQQH